MGVVAARVAKNGCEQMQLWILMLCCKWRGANWGKVKKILRKDLDQVAVVICAFFSFFICFRSEHKA